jgi:DNA adenine methylase
MLPYIGGKSYLAGWIISHFPKDYQKLSYCEVFGGGGWVLFKKEQSCLETYNDLNKNLVNLFRVIRDNFPEFEHKSQWSLHSREMYQEAKIKLQDDKFASQLERAIHTAIYQKQSFAGKGGWGYAVKGEKIMSGLWLPLLSRLELINARLKRVQIECLDFERVIDKYDGKDTLFYLDPPYVGVEHYYKTAGVNFTADDHIRLAAILKQIKGKFVLSYYENELVRKLYKRYNIIKKEATKHSRGITRASGDKPRPKSVELLIRNY